MDKIEDLQSRLEVVEEETKSLLQLHESPQARIEALTSAVHELAEALLSLKKELKSSPPLTSALSRAGWDSGWDLKVRGVVMRTGPNVVR